MRLFVKRKRAERQKQRKMLAEIVVRKAKARNDRVNRQSKMLQSISEQAAKRALQMRQAKRFINNTDQVNHIEKHIKQTRKSVLLVKESAAEAATRAKLKADLKLQNAAEAAKIKKKEAEIASKLSRLRTQLNKNPSRSRRSSWVSDAALQSANQISRNEEQVFAKGDRIEVSLPCPGRSTEDVLTGFVVEDCFPDHSTVTYSSGVELKLQFDDGLTSNVPKELIRHSTAPAPFKVSTPTNETVDHKERVSESGKMESQEKAQLPRNKQCHQSREFTIKRKRSLL